MKVPVSILWIQLKLVSVQLPAPPPLVKLIGISRSPWPCGGHDTNHTHRACGRNPHSVFSSITNRSRDPIGRNHISMIYPFSMISYGASLMLKTSVQGGTHGQMLVTSLSYRTRPSVVYTPGIAALSIIKAR